MKKIYIIHENDEWTKHLTNHLEALQLPFEEWFLDEGILDMTKAPPEGVFYNRMSASSHTRGHRFAPEFTTQVIKWLEHHGRKVINGSNAIQLEVSKVLQYLALEKEGVRTPKTVAAIGRKQIIPAAQSLDVKPFITKHNRAGKGLGVRLFHGIEALKQYVESDEYEEPVDGITLIQEYIQSPDSFIIRCEFINGKFYYAVKVDTSEGFELCPADVCQIDDLACPISEESEKKGKFEIMDGFKHPILLKYEQVLQKNKIDVAGIEFIQDENGEIYTYDINTNTNYNEEAESRVNMYGMLKLAHYLGEQLKILS
ncbi:alpha-L-glutamate ligase [Bacillus spongiae]|uniref:Alpha-L-glutamate ligase n=1 Tax=Bacillus spongiae TaxID=2683610 RepID=A0ABU8HAN2_9BACI